jgi:hypothetical protein
MREQALGKHSVNNLCKIDLGTDYIRGWRNEKVKKRRSKGDSKVVSQDDFD